MILSSLLGLNSIGIEFFFPVYTLEKLILFPETALQPLRKDGLFLWDLYFYNIYSILFSCWAHRHALLIFKPDCAMKSVCWNVLQYFITIELLSVAWGLAEIAPAYWGILVILILLPIAVLSSVGLSLYLTKFGVEPLAIEVKARKLRERV
ncbi:hypothetical protein MCEMAEM4_02675 [Burkholderiaceae bacterium]